MPISKAGTGTGTHYGVHKPLFDTKLEYSSWLLSFARHMNLRACLCAVCESERHV